MKKEPTGVKYTIVYDKSNDNNLYTKENAIAIHNHFENELESAPCSKGHHLAIRGGLMIHTNHVMVRKRDKVKLSIDVKMAISDVE